MQELLSRLLQNVDIYKPAVPSGWTDTDKAWELVATIPMYIESVTGTDSIMNQQSFQSITEFGMSPIEYKGIVQEGYGIIDADGVQRINKGTPETWPFILTYCGYSLKREQFLIETTPST